MKANPFPYQLETIKQIEQFGGRALLASDMGLGKTLTCLWWWQRHPEAQPGLVVCPASAKAIWVREALENLGVRPLVCEGRTPKPFRLGEPQSELTVVNYDVLDGWLPWLSQRRFKSLILDECHYASNPLAKRTKAVRFIAREVPYMVAISGTPLRNRPIELFPTLQMLRPEIFRSRTAYAHQFCKPRWTPWGWKYDGASRIPQLHDLLRKTCMIRYRKEDVLTELPEKVRRVLPLPLSNEEEYKEASESFLRWIGRRNPARLASAERAEAVVRLGELKRLAARLKLRAAVDWANEWLESYPQEKLVLFAIHRKMIEALERRVRARSVVVDGNVSWQERRRAVDAFQQDESVRVFIGNVQAAGVSISLTASSTVAFCEMDWVPANMTQAEDRIHRIGQSKTSWIWWLVASGTIEDDLCKILEQKQRVVSDVLDGDYQTNELNVYEQLLKRLTERRKEESHELV